MNIILSLSLILLVVLLYYFFINLFTILFRLTGLTKEKARFQAISVFTNCGYTTRESEIITSEPSRRKLALVAMITGHVFSVAFIGLIVNLFFSDSSVGIEKLSIELLLILVAFVLLIVISKIPVVESMFESLIEKIYDRITSKKSKDNVITIIDTYGEECFASVCLKKLPAFMEDKSLKEMAINSKYGINILVCDRNKKTIHINKDTLFAVGDVLYVFGKKHQIKEAFGLKKDELNKIAHENKVVSNTIKLISNYESEAMIEISLNIIPEQFKNKKLGNMRIKEDYKINVLTVLRNDKLVHLDKDFSFEEKDIVVVYGSLFTIKDLFLKEVGTHEI